jgi:hypothetical protein
VRNTIHNIQHTRFVEDVLGISITLDQRCTLMEGIMPSILREQIMLETAIYEGFLDDLAIKIGGVPKALAKTFTDARSVLTFIYNVVSDKTGENLKKATTIIKRNAMGLFAKIERLATNLPAKVKEIFDNIIQWIKTKVQNLINVQSDTDKQDDIQGDGGNWKKFILLLLVGMVLIFLKQLPLIIKDFGEDIAGDGLGKLWDMSQSLMSKFLTSPAELAKLVTGGTLINTLMPILAIYKSVKIFQSIQDELLDSNAWLRKT